MNDKNRIVITGAGVVTSAGLNVNDFWQNVQSGKSFIKLIERFDVSTFPCRYAGEITNFDAIGLLTKRVHHKLDCFTEYALIASKEALIDSRLPLDTMDKSRIGVYVGNMLAGWEFTERQLRNLYVEGIRSVSPFLGTAWFPAAPQGEISIANGFRGHSKTLDAGRASGLASIGYAAQAIIQGRIDYALAGGTESMLNAFMLTSCSTLKANDNCYYLSSDNHYEPFGKIKSGSLPGEGSAFLVLESLSSAHLRGATIYGEIRGFGHVNEACSMDTLAQDGTGLRRAIQDALKNSSLSSREIDLIIADGVGTELADSLEAKAIKDTFPDNSDVLVTVPKSIYGDMFGSAGAVDTAIAALTIKNQRITGTVNERGIGTYGINLVKEPREATIKNILITSRGHGGIAMSLIISNVPA